jgi:hypothetical protein
MDLAPIGRDQHQESSVPVADKTIGGSTAHKAKPIDARKAQEHR